MCGGRMSCTGGENGAEFVRERNRFCICVARSLQQSPPSSLCSGGAHILLLYTPRVRVLYTYIAIHRYWYITGIYLYDIILVLYDTLRIYTYIMCRSMLATCVCSVYIYVTRRISPSVAKSLGYRAARLYNIILCCVMCISYVYIRTSIVVR